MYMHYIDTNIFIYLYISATIELNWLPEVSTDELADHLNHQRTRNANKYVYAPYLHISYYYVGAYIIVDLFILYVFVLTYF